MAHEFAQSLNIAALLQASGGKRVPKRMWMNRTNHRLFQVSAQAFAIAAWLYGFLVSAGQKPDIIMSAMKIMKLKTVPKLSAGIL